MYTEPPDGRYNLASIATIDTKPSISTQIIQARHSDITDILRLREIAWQSLKPLPKCFINGHINQFYVAIIEDTIVGCCRIFKNHSMYELGSLVSSEKWVWSELIGYAENFANQKHRWIIAVTRNSILSAMLWNRSWTDSDLFPKRLKESPEWSKLWLHWWS